MDSTSVPGSLALVALLAGVAFAMMGIARLLQRRIPGAHVAAFVLLACLPFPRAFLGDRTPLPLDHVPLTHPWLPLGHAAPYNPYLNDVVSQILPWTEAVRLAWNDGVLPLRNRWNGCGTPLAANSQSAAFSLFTLLTLPLPLASAFLFLGPAKLIIAMAGMWLWVRELAATQRAAFFAAVAFGLSLTFSQWLFFPQTAVFCLWPWMLFLLERGRDRVGRSRAVVALGIVLAIGALAGHPESMAVGVLFAVFWLAGRWLARDLKDAGAILSRLGLAGLSAVGMTFFLLVPSILAIRASNRLVLAMKPHWEPLLSPWPHGPIWRGVATAFFPYSLGDLIHSPVLAGATGAVAEMDLGYFGIVGWAAALLVLRPGSRRPRSEWVLVGLVVCGLAVAVAQWPFAELFSLIPGIRNMFPLRFYSWIALAGPAIAAFELDRYTRDAAERPRAVWGALVVPFLLAASAFVVFKHFRPEHVALGGAFQRSELIVALVALLLACGFLALGRVRPGLAVIGLAAVCAGELLHHWRGLYPLNPVSLLYPQTPLIRFLQTQDRPFRVAGEDNAMFPNGGVFARVEDVRTHDPVERADYVAFLDATCGYPRADYFKWIRNPDASVFNFLNVRYMISAPDGRSPGARWKMVYAGNDGNVYENGEVLPRAFVPERVQLVAAPAGLREPVKDANAAFGSAFRAIAGNGDWRGRAWVLWHEDGEAPGGKAEILEYAEYTNAITFRARVAEGPACIVLSVVQDGGWSARDEKGTRIPVFRANGPFFAVALMPGEHTVHLSYWPPGFITGSLITVATAVVLAAAAVIAGRRRSKAVAAPLN
jgi:hypothetical protein